MKYKDELIRAMEWLGEKPNTIFTGQAIAAGPGGTTFDSSVYGTEDVASFGGFTGLYFDVTVN